MDMRARALASLVASAGLVALGACSGGGVPLPEGASAIEVVSERFIERGRVRPRYTCDGANVSPDLAWSGVPADGEAIVIILDDPDARGFTHWLVYDVPASVTHLPEAGELPAGGRHGQTDFGGRLGYAGPCPPRGQAHRYVLHVYAVDRVLGLEPGASRGAVLGAMEGHVVGHGSLSGLYQRAEGG